MLTLSWYRLKTNAIFIQDHKHRNVHCNKHWKQEFNEKCDKGIYVIVRVEQTKSERSEEQVNNVKLSGKL